ncbi:MAG: peptidylprolyl isomerase, partial [Nitrospinota bacterium]
MVRTLAVQELIRRQVTAKVRVSEAEVREHFDRNPDEFSQKESVTLSHIVVPTLREAREVLAELRKGRSFGSVARERSVFEGTRNSGGVMGAVTRGQLQRELEEVAFRLKVGEVSEPI